jgi:hypothetical protein
LDGFEDLLFLNTSEVVGGRGLPPIGHIELQGPS